MLPALASQRARNHAYTTSPENRIMGLTDLNIAASLSDALGRTRSFEYDPAGQVTAETLPGGRTIAYAYDANGNLTSIAPLCVNLSLDSHCPG